MDTSSKSYDVVRCPECSVNLMAANHNAGCPLLPERAAGGEKLSNPKDIIGSDKVPLDLVPGTTKAYLAIGHLEGMLKYGLVNWREAGVRASIYLAALDRHVEKWKNGEWCDPETQVPHLANAIACLSIIIDAIECGKLTDDRPKQAPVGDVIARMSYNVKHLKEIYGHHNPKHYTHETPSDLHDGPTKERKDYHCITAIDEALSAHCETGRYQTSPTRPEVYSIGRALREGDQRRDDTFAIPIGPSGSDLRRDKLQPSNKGLSQVQQVDNGVLRGDYAGRNLPAASPSNRTAGLGSGNPSDVGSKGTFDER